MNAANLTTQYPGIAIVSSSPNREADDKFPDVMPQFPDELKKLNRWIVRTSNKRPYSPYEKDASLGPIDPHDEQHQGDYDAAMAALDQTSKFAGAGFVFNYADGYTGVDFDDCVNSDTSEIRADVLEIITRCDTYAEISPSGTGVHLFVKGWQVPIGPNGEQGAKVGKAEIYSGKRYFTTSGNHVEGTPLTVNSRDVNWLYERIVTNREFEHARAGVEQNSGSSSESSGIVTKKKPGLISTRFNTLMSGTILRSKETGSKDFAIEDEAQVLEYESQSAADYALLRLIADDLETEDVERIKAKFLESPLGQRDKATRGDYLARSISKLLKEPRKTDSKSVPLVELEATKSSESIFDMSPEEIAEQEEAEYPVYKLRETAGPHFDEATLYGPVGKIASKICQFSEAHVGTVYLNLLISFGNMFGRGAYFNVNDTKHFTIENLACIGDSSTGRKGTSSDAAEAVLNLIEANWMTQRNTGGFASPQAILDQIKDDSTYQKLDKKTGVYVTMTQPGIKDKRLCVREGELSNVFKLISDPKQRAGELFRNLFDGKRVSNLVAGKTDEGEHKSLTCSRPHVSIIGSTTPTLVKATLPFLADTSGDGNRFIWCYTKRLKLVPNGGPPIDWASETIESNGIDVPLLSYLYEMVERAKGDRFVPFTRTANKAWDRLYRRLEGDRRSGFVGNMTSRAVAHIRRIAMILCLIDMEDSIDVRHLKAAEAIWDYSQESARFIFTGYSFDQAKILGLAQERATSGVTLQDIHDLFSRHKRADWIKAQIKGLVDGGYLSELGEKYTFKRS